MMPATTSRRHERYRDFEAERQLDAAWEAAPDDPAIAKAWDHYVADGRLLPSDWEAVRAVLTDRRNR